MSLVKSAGKLFAANVIRSVFGFFGIVFFARTLGAAELGMYFLFQALLGLFSIPADFGINSALKKRVSEGFENGAYLSSAIILKLVSVSAISALIIFSQKYINGYIGRPLAIYLAIGLVFQQYAQLMTYTLHGELRVGETASIEMIEQSTWLSLGTILVLQGYGVRSLVYGFLASQAVKFTIAWVKSRTKLTFPHARHFTSVFDYSKYSVISSIGGYAYSWLDILVIGFFLTASHVGAYEVAWRITGFVLLFSQSVGMTVFPQISEWSVENAEKKIEELIPKATISAVTISVPAFFGTLLFSSDIIELLFGQEYLLASSALIILMLETIFQSVHKIWGYSLQAIDRPDQAAAATIMTLVVNLVLNLALVPIYGLAGAACATALSFALNTGLHAYYLSRPLSLTIDQNKIIWCVVASVSMAGLLYMVQSTISNMKLINLISIISLGVFVYFAIILIYKPLRADILSVLDRIIPLAETR